MCWSPTYPSVTQGRSEDPASEECMNATTLILPNSMPKGSEGICPSPSPSSSS
jgi:hypothetical protein